MRGVKGHRRLASMPMPTFSKEERSLEDDGVVIGVVFGVIEELNRLILGGVVWIQWGTGVIYVGMGVIMRRNWGIAVS